MKFILRVIAIAYCAGIMLMTPASAMPGDAIAWGARDPGSCPSIRLTGTPTPAQVATMVRCRHETIVSDGGELWLMENLNVAVGAPMPFASAYNSFVMAHADVRSRVYPIRGSFTWSTCMTRHDAGIYGNPDLNCNERDVQAAKGVCWKTSFGDWSCLFTGAASGRRDRTRPPGPARAR